MALVRNRQEYQPKIVQRNDGKVFCINGMYGIVLETLQHAGSMSVSTIGYKANIGSDLVKRMIKVLCEHQLVKKSRFGVFETDDLYTCMKFQMDFELMYVVEDRRIVRMRTERCVVVQFEDGRIGVMSENALKVLQSVKVCPAHTQNDRSLRLNISRSAISQYFQQFEEAGLVETETQRYFGVHKQFKKSTLLCDFEVVEDLTHLEADSFAQKKKKNIQQTQTS